MLRYPCVEKPIDTSIPERYVGVGNEGRYANENYKIPIVGVLVRCTLLIVNPMDSDFQVPGPVGPGGFLHVPMIDSDARTHDFALVKLKEAVVFGPTVRRICLPPPDTPALPGPQGPLIGKI